MIPRTINYCWFGHNPLNTNVKKCIRSWKEKCPDYKIIQWNESNFNINDTPNFVKKAYKEGKWAFVSDYARLKIIYDNGGVYLDTDVELLKSLDKLINIYNTGYMGFEDIDRINTGLGFAAQKNDSLILELMNSYNNLNFDINDLSNLSCPVINTQVLVKNGLLLNNSLQKIDNIEILPTDYLCPENMYTGKTKITSNTISIHHYNASWMSPKELLRMKVIIFLKGLLPSKLVNKIRNSVRNRNENI